MQYRSSRRILIVSFAASCALGVTPSLHAGDLNAETTEMFNNLGAIGNYTQPGAFRGQTFNTYAGGSLYLRSPNKSYQLMAVAFPSAKAGCGGIDLFGGSFSHISAEEFKNMLRNITAALPGIAFQLALETVSPMLGGLTKWAKGLETWVNNARISSCESAKALVSSAAEAAGFDQQEACAKLAVELALEPDIAAARQRCKTDRPGVLGAARTSPDADIRNQAPIVGNLIWNALQTIDSIDDPARELLMSLVGTVIYYPETENRDPSPIYPTVTKVEHLLYGQADAGVGNINIQLLQCNNYSECDQVTTSVTYVHVPLTRHVEDLMLSISNKIAARQPIPNDSPEVGFVNRTSEPVWRMLSVGNTIPGSALAMSMIQQYKEVIAADYAFTFLDQNLRAALPALEKQWLLNDAQRDHVAQVRARAQAFLTQLAQEKNTLYAKKSSVTAMATYLEQLERRLRSAMPQSVIDSLGYSAFSNTR